MKIKKDDSVIVISGKDRGKTGKVSKSFPKENKIVITGVNVVKSHERANKKGGKGQIVEKAMPFPASNVMLIDPKTGTRTRFGVKEENGKKIRITKKSGSVL